MPKNIIFKIKNKRVFHNNISVTPDRFQVKRHLGNGANGSVFEAFDNSLKRKVALKLWYPNANKNSFDRAKNEIQKLAAVNHRYFATVYEIQNTEEIIWMVMELVDGVALKQIIEKMGFFNRCQIWEAFAKSMKYLYAQNILHGDPHTGNIIISRHFPAPENSNTDDLPPILKLVDLGTSTFWNKHNDFETRESSVLRETYERLFHEFNYKDFLKIKHWKTPQDTLKTLKACHNLNCNFIRLGYVLNKEKGDIDYSLRSVVGSIANYTPAFPVMDLEKIWQKLLDLQLNDDILGYFLDLLCAKPDPKNPDTSNVVLNAYSKDNFSKALEYYNQQQEDWMRGQVGF